MHPRPCPPWLWSARWWRSKCRNQILARIAIPMSLVMSSWNRRSPSQWQSSNGRTARRVTSSGYNRCVVRALKRRAQSEEPARQVHENMQNASEKRKRSSSEPALTWRLPYCFNRWLEASSTFGPCRHLLPNQNLRKSQDLERSWGSRYQ